jgi:SH3-like domain-containing protein
MKLLLRLDFSKSMNAVAIATAFSFVMCAFVANAQTTLPATPATPKLSFVNIGDKPAVLFDAPSAKANKTHIVLRQSPLEVLVKLDKWTKVRDHEGTIGWVENDTLAARNTPRLVMVNVITADIRAAADASANLTFEAQRNVLLEITSAVAPMGWLAVKHRDGQAGFVRLMQVWGE